MDENLRMQWRDEARKAVTKAAVDGEKRGREAAAAEFETVEFNLKQKIKDLEEAASLFSKKQGDGKMSIESFNKMTTKKAKQFLSSLYSKVQVCIGKGETFSKEEILKVLKPVLIGEVDSLDSVLHEVAQASLPISSKASSQDAKCQTDFVKDFNDGETSTSDELSGPTAYRPSLNEPPPALFLWPDSPSTEQHGEGVFGSYVTYSILTNISSADNLHKVSSRRDLATLGKLGQAVRSSRRFSEFVTLREALLNHLPKHSLVVVPSLPKQKLGERLQSADTLVNKRRVRLGLWLQHVSGHPILAYARPLSVFCCTTLSAVPTCWRNAIDSASLQGEGSLIDANMKRGSVDVNLTQNQQKALGARLVASVIKETMEEATILQGLLERALESEKKLADAYSEAGESLLLLGELVGSKEAWCNEEARSLPVIAPGVLISSKAAETCANATRLHSAEPIRFHARPCMEAALSSLDRFKRLGDEHLEGVDVSKEWRQLARLRGAALTLGMADAVRVAEEESSREKDTWAKVVSSLEDSLGVQAVSFTSELELLQAHRSSEGCKSEGVPKDEAGRKSEGPSGHASPLTAASTPTEKEEKETLKEPSTNVRQTSVAATISSFFSGGDSDPKPPSEPKKVDNMDDAYRSRAEAFAKRQADNDAEKKRIIEERRAEAAAALAEAEELKRAKRSNTANKSGARLKRRDNSLDPAPRTRRDTSLDPAPRTRRDNSLDPAPRTRRDNSLDPAPRSRAETSPNTTLDPTQTSARVNRAQSATPSENTTPIPTKVSFNEPTISPDPTPQPVSEPTSSDLPFGWEEVVQADGSVYYYHRRSRMSRWEKPDPQMAADIEERMNAEQAATDEAVARRREEMDAAAAERDAISAKSEALKRQAEKKVSMWAGGRSLAVLLGDLQSVYPHAPDFSTPEDNEIKKTYMKAARIIHPDKVKVGSVLPGGGVVDLEQAVLAEVVFTVLSSKYESFKE